MPIFSSQNSSLIFREYLRILLSGIGEIKNYLQYPSNTREIFHLTVTGCKNLFFNEIFLMHSDLNIIIKIFSTIYLLLLILFLSIPFYWNHESWVHKYRKVIHDKTKKGHPLISASQRHLDL